MRGRRERVQRRSSGSERQTQGKRRGYRGNGWNFHVHLPPLSVVSTNGFFNNGVFMNQLFAEKTKGQEILCSCSPSLISR